MTYHIKIYVQLSALKFENKYLRENVKGCFGENVRDMRYLI